MILGQAAQKSFIFLPWTVLAGHARPLLETLPATHVIIHGRRGYHLLTKAEAAARLAGRHGRESLANALRLDEETPVEACDAHTEVNAAPERCVVLAGGYPSGFFERALLRTVAWGQAKGPLTLVADFPERVSAGDLASLRVWLAADLKAGLGLEAGARVDVVVEDGDGLALEVGGEAGLFVPAGRMASPALEFRLKALEEGRGRINVLALHEGQPLGRVELRPPIDAAPPGAPPETSRRREPLGVVEVVSPDLSLLVLESKVGSETLLDLRLTAADPALGLNLTRYGPLRLRSNAFQYFKEFFADVETLSPDAAGRQRLERKGAGLFESLLPEGLRRKLWEHRGLIHSMQVQSEEPWIPWELCRLTGEEGGRVAEGEFFCERFALTRWMPGVAARPTLRLGEMALVAPTDSGLAFAEEECRAIEEAAAGRWRVSRLKAGYLEVCAAMAGGTFHSWHFTGHGNAGKNDPNRATVVLEEKQSLTAEEISGVNTNLGLTAPLVFLNACRVAQAGFSLTGVGGWASQFLRAGAGAFVGTWWAVYDRPAADFARAFYAELSGGTPIGEAARLARAAIRPAGDATWLAYTVYAHPLAAVSAG